MDLNQIDGLSSREASIRQKKYGFNELPNRDKRNIFKIIIGLVTEPMIFLLIATVTIYFFLGDPQEAFLLLLSIFVIIGIELYQESKTEKSLEALRNLSSPISDVIRDGKRITIPGREVVVGDIIILSEGSRVPVDAKLITANNLKVDESLLTGESEAVEKHTREIKDFRVNSVFSGTLVIKGHAIAEATSIGAETEIGKIGVSLKSIATEKTLLQKEVNKVIKIVATLAIGFSAILVIFYWLERGSLIQGLLAGLTLAISILPEEFPIVLTIFLTMGAWRLAKNNVLTRRAHTIETLGSASVLCVDKTGTLTENKMTIMSLTDSKGNIYQDDFSKADEVIKFGVLASQKKPFDPMEEAFIITGEHLFGNVNDIYGRNEIIKEYPVEDDSLSVVNIWGSDGDIKKVALKGAPETVFDLCHISKTEQQKLESVVKEFAAKGLRVIGVAKGEVDSNLPKNRHDYSFEFLGLVGLTDPVRKEAASAVKMCREAGIRVVMITGDYPETALHIAKEVGLDYGKVITGAEFENLPEKKRREIIKTISVFSRVTPNHKLVIVNAFKDNGEVVAMTGDGVNDAPALKSANIGIAMGKRGTDVAREAATIVLLDDNFTSIVKGIRLGRRIYTNLQKAMSYIFSVHIPIAALSLLPVLFGWPLALVPIHIVFLELIIDPSCTIIFENEKESWNIMQRPPRRLNQPIFSRHMVMKSILQGIFIASVVVVSYKILLDYGWAQDKARGMTFLILLISNIFLVITISGRQALANIFHRENKAMLLIFSLTILSLILIFNVPYLREMFRFDPLNIQESVIGISIGAFSALLIIPILKMYKITFKH
ncbi:MAG: cation-translocating P-type ATPase [Candidatus Saccharibacteria bacterium]